MKLIRIVFISFVLVGLLHAEVEKEPMPSFYPKIEINNNLTTIIPNDGELIPNNRENVISYLLSKIDGDKINLDNGTINFCGEHTYIIGVGVNQYQYNKNISFPYAISNATKISDKVKSSCMHTSLYLLKDANRKTILENIKNVLKKATVRDSVIFYYSGMGFRYKNSNYIEPFDAKEPIFNDTYISTESIYSSFKESKIKIGLMIFDVSTNDID